MSLRVFLLSYRVLHPLPSPGLAAGPPSRRFLDLRSPCAPPSDTPSSYASSRKRPLSAESPLPTTTSSTSSGAYCHLHTLPHSRSACVHYSGVCIWYYGAKSALSSVGTQNSVLQDLRQCALQCDASAVFTDLTSFGLAPTFFSVRIKVHKKTPLFRLHI